MAFANQRSRFRPNYRIDFHFSFAFASSRCSSVSYRMDNMKEGNKLNVRLKAMRFDEAICEVEVVIPTVTKAHQLMATNISRKI